MAWRATSLVLLAVVVAGCMQQPLLVPAETSEPVSIDARPCATPVQSLDHPCVINGLDAGEAVFWDGGDLPAINQAPPADVCTSLDSCWAYPLTINPMASGVRLRVDVQVYFADPNYIRPLADNEHSGPETYVGIALLDPTGVVRASTDTMGSFAADTSLDASKGLTAGTWTVRVDGLLPDTLKFRLRAFLEPPNSEIERVEWPDLQILPPFEIGFIVPTMTIQPGVPTPVGIPAATCMAEEYAEAAAEGLPAPVLCLRFSMGLYNSGHGGFRLTELPIADENQRRMAEAGLADIPMVQWVCTASGAQCEALPRPDGLVARWHQTHVHYHYQNAYVYDLYRVERTPGEMPSLEFQATSGKLGLDPTQEVLEGWNRFYQQPKRMPDGQDSEGTTIGGGRRIQAGWGDIYDWNRAGNYIDFPRDAMGQPLVGEYVIRGTTDPDGHVEESNEANNAAYGYFRLSGVGAVDLLERGYGNDPWDPAKTVLDVVP